MKHQLASYPLRLPEDIRKTLEVEAKENGRSLNSEIVQRLKTFQKEETEKQNAHQ